MTYRENELEDRPKGMRKTHRQMIPFMVVALLSGLAFFGSYAPPILSLFLFGILLALAYFDWQQFRLPNYLTAILFAAGCLYVFLDPRWPREDHLIGAVIGLLIFPLLNAAYKKLRGREGIGFGDAKLLAGIGLWLGWPSLPLVLLTGSVSGILYVISNSIITKNQIGYMTRLPFGSFLCLGAWVCWLYL